MSSSGLIFAMIVGAWAAYLVPMWLRRQDELNEARPTERFSTALRLLTRGRRGAPATETAAPVPAPDPAADLRAFAEPVVPVPAPASPSSSSPSSSPSSPSAKAAPPSSARAKVLIRRRRTTMILFLAFTLGGIYALSAGPGHLWIPLLPGVLLIAYLAHVRRHEQRRYAVALDRRRAEEAARRLRERTAKPPVPEQPAQAIVEQTDHAEWEDQQRRRTPAPEHEPESWDPAPVPLPTYVNAPVAPRTTRGVNLDAPDTWSAARSTTAGTTPQSPPAPRTEAQPPQRTPLFDQYADEDHRRVAGE